MTAFAIDAPQHAALRESVAAALRRAILEALARADGAAAERLLDDHLRKGERATGGALRRLARRGLVRATGG